MTPQRENELWLRILAGEAPLDALPADRREPARRALEALRAVVAAPAFDAGRLRRGLRALPPAPRVLVVRQTRSPRRVAAVLAAAVLLVAGLAIAWRAAAPEAPVKTALPALERRAPGLWRIAGRADLRAQPGAAFSESDSGDDAVVLLRHGAARLSSDAATPAGTEILRALDSRVSVAVSGGLDVALHAAPEQRALALSVFAAEPGAALTTVLRGTPLSFAFSSNSDALIVLPETAAAGTEASAVAPRVAHWPDVFAATPPTTPGEILIRLRSGRVAAGTVTSQNAEGLLLSRPEQLAAAARQAGREPTERERIFGRDDPHQPESILFDEIVAWTPRDTPRGRETYARWLQELVPAQLRGLEAVWTPVAAQLAPGPLPTFEDLMALDEDWRLPDVVYSVESTPDGPVLKATHGLSTHAWTLDGTGRLSSPAQRYDRDF